MILLDTSGLLAAIDDDEQEHAAAAAVLRSSEPPFLLSPFVLAELDYLLARRLGRSVCVRLLDEVSRGVYRLAQFAASDIAKASAIVGRYADLDVSLADASTVVLAHREGASEVLTLDHRHFRVLPGPGGPFRLLPADG